MHRLCDFLRGVRRTMRMTGISDTGTIQIFFEFSGDHRNPPDCIVFYFHYPPTYAITAERPTRSAIHAASSRTTSRTFSVLMKSSGSDLLARRKRIVVSVFKDEIRSES